MSGTAAHSASHRSVAEIQQQLSAFEDVMARAEEYGNPDFASTVGLESIRAHHKELLNELVAAAAYEAATATVREIKNVTRDREDLVGWASLSFRLIAVVVATSFAVLVTVSDQVHGWFAGVSMIMTHLAVILAASWPFPELVVRLIRKLFTKRNG